MKLSSELITLAYFYLLYKLDTDEFTDTEEDDERTSTLSRLSVFIRSRQPGDRDEWKEFWDNYRWKRHYD